jgi:2'-5' RNA ligase
MCLMGKSWEYGRKSAIQIRWTMADLRSRCGQRQRTVEKKCNCAWTHRILKRDVSAEERVRAFVAIHVPGPVREKLRQMQKDLEAAMPGEAVRWTAFDQLHLTLEFLGKVDQIENLTNALRKVASAHKKFALEAKSVGAFSSVRNPRVIWAAIVGDVDALKTLQGDVRTAVGPWLEEAETRAYRPHLTLGRVRPVKPRELPKVSEALAGAAGVFGSWVVKEFHLMQSKLSPHGAQHSVLATFALEGIQGCNVAPP